MKFRAIAVLSVLAVGSSLATAGTAGLGTVQDLIDAGATGITVGDKQFYNFSYQGTGVAADAINVIRAPGSDVGLEFQFNWSSTGGVNEDSVIRYNVHVTDPGRTITAIGLHFDGNATNNTSLLTNANVTETLTDLSGNSLGSLSVINFGSTFGSLNRNDATLSLASLRDLAVTKDIMVHSAAPTLQLAAAADAVTDPTATITLVDNTFKQNGTSSVPLPPAAWMAVSTLGLGALAPLRRRFRSLVNA
jgi:hypothetical protein